MSKSAQNLTLVLNVVDLLGLEDFDLLEDLGCEVAVGLLLLHEADPSEGPCIFISVPTPIVLRTS